LAGSGSKTKWVYPEIVKSRTLARKMLKRNFDTQEFGQQKSLLQILTYGLGEPNVGLDTLEKAGISSVLGMIEIYSQGSFYVLNIRASEPLFARDFASALIEELDDHQRQYNNAKVRETREFIEVLTQETKKELNAAEETLKIFSERNRRIENSPSLLLEQQRLSREVSVKTAVFTTLKQQLETSKIEEVKKSDFVIVLDPPEAPLSYSKPRKKSIIVFSILFGIGLGIFFAFIKDNLIMRRKEDKQKMDEVKSLVRVKLVELVSFKKN
jgi:hypothetical protein